MIQRKYLAPNAITATSMFLGFLSMISSIKLDFERSVLFIILAMICDGLDGKTARKLDAFSEFGKEFDSFADAISFGIAPAIMIYCRLNNFDVPHEQSKNIANLITPIAFLYAFCGVMRLVKFNVVTVASSEKDDFSGMPIPNAASMICSYFIICNSINKRFDKNFFSPQVCMGIAALAAMLMVSTIQFKTPEKAFSFIPKKLFIPLVLVIVATLYYSLFIFTFVYVFINLLNSMKKRFYNKSIDNDDSDCDLYDEEFERDDETHLKN
ncbi:CDP-diacylglycerol--serine O-phosphatidyltransferase [Fusobacterium sp. PH5-44]|uniref:CDP-diacylglycerol--serine O-phosphatidyltransferase n=1 Tax=unclassified Fusobacterium TaxID=2648384 RepID=UPI003D1AB5D6